MVTGGWVKVVSKHYQKMSLLEKFLSLDEIKQLQGEKNFAEVGRLAISMGTIGRDKDLRKYGTTLLRNEKEV